MSTAATSTMRLDLLSAYGASGAKVVSWVIVSAVVFRASPLEFAVLALIRATLALLNYTTLGLAPAMVRLLSVAGSAPAVSNAPSHADAASKDHSSTLTYETPRSLASDPIRSIFASAQAIGWICVLIAAVATSLYAFFVGTLHEIPDPIINAEAVVAGMGFGTIYRLFSDASGAVLQVRGRIARDNSRIVIGETVWVVLVLAMMFNGLAVMGPAACAAGAYAVSGILVWALRNWEAKRELGLPLVEWNPKPDAKAVKVLLVTGSLIAVAQMADFLFAPIDFILINRLISPEAVAIYAPLVQIDAGLLLLVGAMSAVLLPKAALAHAAGDNRALRRYYVRGTLLSASLLLTAGVAVYLLSAWIFELWLGDPLPVTQTILPLVLIHTVVGGSSGVGRSILLGMGKVKSFAIAAIATGVLNVIASYAFVKFGGLGLKGIVYGTIVAVVARAIVWQPWYVLRTLRREAQIQRVESMIEATPELLP